MPPVPQESIPVNDKGKNVDNREETSTPAPTVQRSSRLSGAGKDVESSVPNINLDSPIHIHEKTPEHKCHTSENANIPEEVSTKQTSPNISVVNIDSDNDSNSFEEIISGFEQEAENLPPEEYPKFGQNIVEEVFDKFQSSEATVPDLVASIPPKKDTTPISFQH